MRWVLSAILVAVGLYLLNLTAYHVWAAGGPPSPNPQWHLMWANRFLMAALVCFAGASALLYLLRRRKLAA